MRSKTRIAFKLFCAFMCSMLLIPMNAFAAPVSNGGASPGKASASFRDTASKPSAKISSRLKEQFSDDKFVTFLVKLKDQADTKKAAEQATKLAEKQKLSAAKTKYTQRSAVVNALRAKANETQANLLAFLHDEKSAGRVKDYESFYIVNGLTVTGTKEVMEKLATFSEVDKILPNERRQLLPVTKSEQAVKAPDKQQTSGKTETNDNNVEWNIERVGAPAVWNMGYDGTGVVVASIDTGVQWDHPALKEKYRGYDPAHPNTPNNQFNWFDAVTGASTPYDDVGHGTHTMGTMVGSEPDGTDRVGMAPGAKWITVKAFTEDGGTDQDLLEAGEWLIAPKDQNGNPHPEMAPDVINNSWGGGPGLDEWYRPMVQNWRAAGIFPEFSAGNTTLFNPGGPGSVAAPANYPESFATGATDINNHLANFSLQGPSPYGEIKPEVVAPGVNIRSSVPGSQYDGTYSGTSMSGPHVSGAVALMLSADSSLTVDEIEQILLDTATPLTDASFPNSPNNGYGYGLLDAFSAVSAVTQGLGTVEGQVTKDGNDDEAPTFEHDAVAEAFVDTDLPLQIRAQDNVSISKVELQYKAASADDWQTVEAEQTDGNYRQGVWQAVIPASAVTEPGISYRWHIVDYGHNDVTSDPYNVTVHPRITVGYHQDFESEPYGWVSYGQNNSWEWGVPTSGPGHAASGDKVYATNLDGVYDNYTEATLVMPPVRLPDGPSYLRFKQWYELETRYDYGYVYISTDKTNWQTLATINGANGAWQDAQVDLSAYAGQNVYIAFHLHTDVSVQKQGWYIDDVELTNTPLSGSHANLAVQPKQTKSSTKSEADGTGKKPIDPSTIKPGKLDQAQPPAPLSVKPAASIQSLPLAATVSVLETGRSVNTNPADGGFSLSHAAGTYTLQAETYGYRSARQTVEIPRDGTVRADFHLDPIPQGTITGTVTNKATHEPIAGATVMVMEDANVQPVQTDASGHFSLTAYEGTYTLHVAAPNYYAQDEQVTVRGNESTDLDLTLKPFIGYPGEIGYDDGTAENAHAFYDAGNAWAVKMELPEGRDSALVTGGMFQFWTTDWPEPGGTSFDVEIYDASGPDGAPGRKLAGPVHATAKRDGTWTVVDLSDQGIVVNGDFYIVYVQTAPYPNAPGLATDESSGSAGHSWERVGGVWAPSPEDEGNYMIRARVNYEVTPPVITAPTDNTYTNNKAVTVTGKAAPTTRVTILNNGQAQTTVSTADDGTFSADIQLQAGDNVLTATASTDSGTTEPSAPVKVVLDQEKPNVTITSPEDGYKTNREAITVTGTVNDANLDTVKVNGQKADIGDDGTYSKRILLDNGANTIRVVARDKAGNTQSRTITVNAKFDAPVISQLAPVEDLYLDRGETVRIEFDSEPGLNASFVVQMPLTNLKLNGLANVNELPMMETAPGHYVGYYTATSNVVANGAQIEVKAEDDYGNVTRAFAPGKLYLNVPNQKPVALFDAPDKVKKNTAAIFDASASYDPDGSIAAYEWDFGDGYRAVGPRVQHAFNKKGNFNVTLKVTDNRGATATVTHKIKVN